VILAHNDYNEIGQLSTKKLHSTDNGNSYLQTITYSYNERGWLTKVNNPASINTNQVFGMNLFYADHADPAKRQYNGNISGLSWQTKVPAGLGLSQEQQSFDYTYDKLNRLLLSNYSAAGSAGKFNEEFSYDKAGNIVTLKRTNSLNGYLNNFSYNYLNSSQSTNQLWSISDQGSAGKSSSYTYDSNGNMTTDNGKSISITYNQLNLPKLVSKASTGEQLTYVYDANGRKLRKLYYNSPRDYIDGIEYNSTKQIEFIQTEEGRAIKTGSSYVYEYFLKDHLGNTRATVKQDGTITQVQDYYSFGMEMNPGNMFSFSPGNFYKYNGKELQYELSLNQLDYGARFYDPVIGRFSTIDPLSEIARKWSPYSYGANNPIRFIDVDGMFVGPGDKFKTADAAAKDFGKTYNATSILKSRELASTIYKGYAGGKLYFSYGEASEGSHASSTPSSAPEGKEVVAEIHSHGAYEKGYNNDNFSTKDIQGYKDDKQTGYVTTPDGSLKKYDPETNKTTVVSTSLPSDAQDPNRKNEVSFTGKTLKQELKTETVKQDNVKIVPVPVLPIEKKRPPN
jgi:RHS repeat-associated protein